METELKGILKHNLTYDEFKLAYFGKDDVSESIAHSFYDDFVCNGKDFDSYVKETVRPDCLFNTRTGCTDYNVGIRKCDGCDWHII